MVAPESISTHQEPARHTATPWTLRKYDYSVVLQGPREIQVMSTSWHSHTRARYPLKPESLANAEFVLVAVNHHDELVSHLRRLATRCCDEEALAVVDSVLGVAREASKP